MRCWIVVFWLSLCCGCGLGPRALERTHGRYNDAIRLVEEEQTLANIVRVRYDESPLVLNVNSVTTQFDFAAAAEARPFFSTEATGNLFRSFSTILPFAQAQTSSRPTFSFDPADDGTAVRQFLTPINTDTLVYLLRNEPRIDVVLRLWVERINGIPNDATGPTFRRIVELFQSARGQDLLSIQSEKRDEAVSGALPASAITAAALVEAARAGMRYAPVGDGKTWVLTRSIDGLAVQVMPGGELSPEWTELRHLLGLKPGLARYNLRFIQRALPDPTATAVGDTIHLTVRSTSRLYRYLSAGVEVPPEHLAGGVARPRPDEEGQTGDLFAVHCCTGPKPPRNAFIAIPYRGRWYYLDDRDGESKATLATVMQLSRLDFKSQTPRPGPALTLPVGR